jgi:general nucleoside transport system ATP-binding protein
VAVLLVSEELEELFEVCDKVAVMTQGRLSPIKAIRETNAEELGLLMGGSLVAREGLPSLATREQA